RGPRCARVPWVDEACCSSCHEDSMLTIAQLLTYRRQVLSVLSEHYPIPADVLLRYRALWDMDALSSNERVVWTDDLIETLADDLHWSNGLVLNDNDALPWSPAFIEKWVGRGKWTWRD